MGANDGSEAMIEPPIQLLNRKRKHKVARGTRFLPKSTIGLMNGTWLSVCDFELHVRRRFLQLHVDSIDKTTNFSLKRIE